MWSVWSSIKRKFKNDVAKEEHIKQYSWKGVQNITLKVPQMMTCKIRRTQLLIYINVSTFVGLGAESVWRERERERVKERRTMLQRESRWSSA